MSDMAFKVLSWLRRPLQRTEDVAVALGVHPVTVFRYLQRFEQEGLVESIAPATVANNGRLYYLTQAGLLTVAQREGTPPEELDEIGGADETTILRLLPRLSTLIVVQNVINSLVAQAPQMLSYPGGRHANLEWHWRRDWHHTFLSKHREMRCAADAALVFYRYPLPDIPEEYKTLFLLADEGLTGNNDQGMITQQLEQLLRYRESAERTLYYQQFPAIVVLVPTPHQCERWQRLAREAAAHLRLAPLRGAVACVPPDQTISSAWTLPWQGLRDHAPCRLQDCLVPMPLEAVPPNILASSLKSKKTDEHQKPIVIRGRYAERAASRQPGEREDSAWLGIELSHRQKALLNLIYAAPLLSTEDIAAFHQLTPDTAARALSTLQQIGCIEREDTEEEGRRWRLTEVGLRLMAAMLHVSLLHLAEWVKTEKGQDLLVQRSLAGLRHTISHTAGVYSFLAMLHRAAQEQGHRIAWWETGSWCVRRYHDHGSWHDLRPDAMLEYAIDARHLRFWLEWDQGQMTGARLAAKLHAYTHYMRSREWARELRPLPVLLVVTPDLGQERRIQRIARSCAEAGLMVRITTVSRLEHQGPLAPIWFTITDKAPPRRQALLDLSILPEQRDAARMQETASASGKGG